MRLILKILKLQKPPSFLCTTCTSVYELSVFLVNRPDEELVRLSPAAAAASSLLKSGMSLTAIYAEHCRVVSELDKKNTEFKQLEKYVTELIQVSEDNFVECYHKH